MCIRDFEEMKNAFSSFRVVTVTTASLKIVTHSPNRIALVLGQSIVGPYTLTMDEPAVFGSGLIVSVSLPPLIFTTAQHGDLPTREWFAIVSAGSINIGIIEVFSPGVV